MTFMWFIHWRLLSNRCHDYVHNEPSHDKTNKMSVRPAKTQISLVICPVWSESLLSAWRKLGSLATHWAHSEDSDQTGQMPRLIWVYAGRTLTLSVLSCRGSYDYLKKYINVISNRILPLSPKINKEGTDQNKNCSIASDFFFDLCLGLN